MLFTVLNWLKTNNPLYSDITINEEHGHENVLIIEQSILDRACKMDSERDPESCELQLTSTAH